MTQVMPCQKRLFYTVQLPQQSTNALATNCNRAGATATRSGMPQAKSDEVANPAGHTIKSPKSLSCKAN